jgi:4-hydroxythreonine-4-phosphate dehydrogenase
MSERLKVAITIGDFNGIGLEVCLKALTNPVLRNKVIPIIYGSPKVVSYHKNILNDVNLGFYTLRPGQKPHNERINVVNCWQDDVNITLGKPTIESGKSAVIALDKAVRDTKEGQADVLVTAPISKEAMRMAEFQFPGHTEFLEKLWGGSSIMVMASDRIKVGLVTGHIPLKDVSSSITKDRVKKKLGVFIKTLREDFGIGKPVVALLGLNPHAGENGMLGSEENDIIRPVVVEEKKNGELVMGPFPADGFFGSGEYTKYDGILAMYHDQGLIPFKTLAFQEGVNYTAGLPFIRTSPDHGTAYNLAGKNEADPKSMVEAIFSAVEIFNNRKAYAEDIAGAVKKTPKPSEED